MQLLQNLPKLPSFEGGMGLKMPPVPDRWKERSKTFEGIAQAMATKWGCLIEAQT